MLYTLFQTVKCDSDNNEMNGIITTVSLSKSAAGRAKHNILQPPVESTILRYANTNKCHIQFIEEYFGESQTAPCKWCDNCLFTPIVERVIITSDAINLLRVCLLVGNIVKKPSPGLIANVYIGSKGREVTKHKLDELSLHGLGKSQSVSAAENLILLLITRKFFKEIAKSRNESQYGDTYLEVTVAGSEVLEGTRFQGNE